MKQQSAQAMAYRLVGIVVALVTALVLVSPVALAAGPDGDGRWDGQGFVRRVDRERQILNGSLTVESGEVIDEDVTVYAGDVMVREGGRIRGNLLVMSGNIEIEEDAAVDGDVTTYSGNVEVAGSVAGNVASMSGNIQLDSTAQVQGDVSVVSGLVEREEGAVVLGNVAEGPRFGLLDKAAPDGPRTPTGVEFARPRQTFFGSILAFLARVIAAIFMTILATLLVVGLFYLRPKIIADTRTILRHQTALSGVIGVVVNLTLLFLAGILAATLCLLPLALVPMLGLIILNTVGWAVAAQIVGERIVGWTKQSVQEGLKIGVGAVVLAGVVTLLWAVGGCFRPLAFLLTLGIASFGTGALILPWLNRRRDDLSGPTSTPEPTGPQSGPDGTGSSTTAPVSGSLYAADVPVESDVAAPLDYVTAEEVNAAQTDPAPRPESTPDRVETHGTEGATEGEAAVELDVAAPLDYVTAEEVNAAQTDPAPRPESTPDTVETHVTEGATGGKTGIELDVAAPLDYVTAEEVNAEARAAEADDFTQIRGVGPAFARRLQAGGLTTFAELAAATPAQVAELLGWPEARVVRDEIIDQARVLAERG
jgi:predicted flap endonuclease-1-like 5' DNA nuclease/cytoskeletal protein CcmA (bactofilin family)